MVSKCIYYYTMKFIRFEINAYCMLKMIFKQHNRKIIKQNKLKKCLFNIHNQRPDTIYNKIVQNALIKRN